MKKAIKSKVDEFSKVAEATSPCFQEEKSPDSFQRLCKIKAREAFNRFKEVGLQVNGITFFDPENNELQTVYNIELIEQIGMSISEATPVLAMRDFQMLRSYLKKVLSDGRDRHE